MNTRLAKGIPSAFSILVAAFALTSQAAANSDGIWRLSDGVHQPHYGDLLADGTFRECNSGTAQPPPKGYTLTPLKGLTCSDESPGIIHPMGAAAVKPNHFATLGNAASSVQSYDALRFSKYLKSTEGQSLLDALQKGDSTTTKRIETKPTFKALTKPTP